MTREAVQLLIRPWCPKQSKIIFHSHERFQSEVQVVVFIQPDFSENIWLKLFQAQIRVFLFQEKIESSR